MACCFRVMTRITLIQDNKGIRQHIVTLYWMIILENLRKRTHSPHEAEALPTFYTIISMCIQYQYLDVNTVQWSRCAIHYHNLDVHITMIRMCTQYYDPYVCVPIICIHNYDMHTHAIPRSRCASSTMIYICTQYYDLHLHTG